MWGVCVCMINGRFHLNRSHFVGKKYNHALNETGENSIFVKKIINDVKFSKPMISLLLDITHYTRFVSADFSAAAAAGAVAVNSRLAFYAMHSDSVNTTRSSTPLALFLSLSL